MLFWAKFSLKRFLRSQGLTNQVTHDFDAGVLTVHATLYQLHIKVEPLSNFFLTRDRYAIYYSSYWGRGDKEIRNVKAKKLNQTVYDCLTKPCYTTLQKYLRELVETWGAQVEYSVPLNLLIIKIGTALYRVNMSRGNYIWERTNLRGQLYDRRTARKIEHFCSRFAADLIKTLPLDNNLQKEILRQEYLVELNEASLLARVITIINQETDLKFRRISSRPTRRSRA